MCMQSTEAKTLFTKMNDAEALHLLRQQVSKFSVYKIHLCPQWHRKLGESRGANFKLDFLIQRHV